MKALGEVGFLDDRSYGFFVGAPDGESLFSMTVSEAARKIAVTEGDVAVSEDIAVCGMEMIVADVSQGASLELVGELSGGGLLKMGAGHLSVENGVNVLTRGVLLSEGYLSVGTFGALGYRPGFGGGLFLKGGTFEYRGDGSEASLPGTLTVAHPENHSPVLIKTESPVTVNGAIVKSGSIIKRGAAPLTFAPPSGTTTELAPYNGTGGGDPAPPYSIGDISGRSDLQPQSGYSGFNIAEGEVRLAGDSNTVFKISQGAMIGVSAVGGREQPALTIDGASVDFSGGSCTVQLCGWTRAGSFNVAPRLSLVNGANVKNYTFTCGRMCETPCYPTVTVDRATWKLTSFRPGYSWQVASQYFVNNGSRIDTQNVVNYGPAYLYVSNSVMTVATKADIHGSSGRWFFGEGSRLELSSITTTHDTPCSSFTLAFDGGEWETGGAVNLFRLYLAEKFHFETCGAGGLAMPIAQGVSLPVCRAITGNGGLVKTGGGTLAFMPQETWDEQFTEKTMLDDPVSLAFAGLLDVREGSVTVSEGACRAEGAYRAAAGANIDFGGNVLASASFSGAGSFANAVVENAVISVSSPSDVPTFDGVSFTGRVEVDFGIDGDAAGELRKNVAVARFADENAVLDVSRWRASNAGKGYTARFSVSGNEIVAEIAKFGTVLTVR
jgi:hypothetical protein